MNQDKTEKGRGSQGLRIMEGEGSMGEGLRVGMVVSRFHSDVADRLVKGALTVFKREGVWSVEQIDVPGAFEIPGVAQQMGLSDQFDVLLCLGAVVKGETDHYHYICSEVSRGLGQVALDLEMPVIFGVLTTASLEQAMARSTDKCNKGAECAETAIAMGRLYQRWQE